MDFDMLTQAELKELIRYEPATGLFFRTTEFGRWRAGAQAGAPRHDGYYRIHVGGSRHLAHRLAWLYMTGEWPREEIDHINGNPSDNRWTNLRCATRRQNQFNLGPFKTNTSGYKNVVKTKSKWGVRIHPYSVGGFESAEDANEFACLMREMLHGEFACHKRAA